MRFPAELLVLACLVVGIAPAWTIGPILESAVRAVVGPTVPPYSLAIWHGFTAELLMSTIALLGGPSLYSALRPYLRSSAGPPLLRHIRGSRIFDRLLVFVSWRLARWLERMLGTRRLQPQLRVLAAVALIAGAAPVYWLGLANDGPLRTTFDPAFAHSVVVGILCALAAAYQAKFHRLAALIMLGGTRPRDLRQLRLAIRARSGADATRRRVGDHGSAAAWSALVAQARRSKLRRRGAFDGIALATL